MNTQTISITNVSEIEQFLRTKQIIDHENLLIQFFSATTDIGFITIIQEFFKKEFPASIFMGSTSDGVIENERIYESVQSVVAFTHFEKTNLSYSYVLHEETYFDSYQSGKSLAQTIYKDNTKAILSFSDGVHTNGEEFLRGISTVDKNIYIAGGMAGDNGLIKETFVFDKENIISNGAIGVAFNSDCLNLRTDYSFDWTPIGKKLLVTKAIKNRVYEIDGLSAVDLYAKYLGEELVSYLPQIGIEFPLILQREGISIGRAVIARHEDNSLSFAGNIEEGEYVQFGVGDVETILRGTDYHVRQLLNKSRFEPETFFIYSCMARRRFIGQHLEQEIQPFAKIAPSVGFFTYGEFFHSKEKNQLMNETMTVLCMTESTKKISFKPQYTVSNNKKLGINPLHIISHLSNVVSSELEELNATLEERVHKSTEEIYKQAYIDRLTDLPNRLKLIDELPDNIHKTLLLLNVDDFTLINDFYGHTIGDAVLKKLASVLNSFTFEEDANVYKLPSDEFAIIVHKVLGEKELIDFIEKLLSLISATDILYDEYLIKVTMTIAAARINIKGTGLVNADMTLKLAKKSGLNYMVFQESLMLVKHYERNLEMAQELRRAINDNDIISYYQPIYDLKTGKIEKYECLVRLKKEDGTVLSPYLFLEMSQKIKLYSNITKIMVQKTFSFFKKNKYNFGINLSFEDILNEETKSFLLDNIKKYDIAQQLTIEILETEKLENENVIKEFIDIVYELGANIAIDDFGSGFANFEHMTKIKSSYIKIDGSLIKNIDTDKNAKLVVETIIVFAQKLGMKTVAEYVHSQAVLEIVKELKIDLVQGFYLSEPLSEI